MSVRALIASGVGLVVTCTLVGACGGKVSGVSSSSGASGGSLDSIPQPPAPSSGGRHGRPPPAPPTPASVGSEIAETYCKAFSTCCVGTGQAPIDVARCRQLVAAEVEARVDPNAVVGAEEVASCVDTIKGRIGVCSSVDAAWWAAGKSPLLAPGTVRQACASIFGFASGAPSLCTSDASCLGPANKCAVDECVAAAPVGAGCAATPNCLDGAVCLEGTCSPSAGVMPKGACTIDDDCQLGLVCTEGLCLPSRDFPELAKPRFSPYRIGADTCRAYTYL